MAKYSEIKSVKNVVANNAISEVLAYNEVSKGLDKAFKAELKESKTLGAVAKFVYMNKTAFKGSFGVVLADLFAESENAKNKQKAFCNGLFTMVLSCLDARMYGTLEDTELVVPCYWAKTKVGVDANEKPIYAPKIRAIAPKSWSVSILWKVLLQNATLASGATEIEAADVKAEVA